MIEFKILYTPAGKTRKYWSGSATLIISVSDPFHFVQPDPDPGSKKSAKIMENFHKNQPKP